MTDEPYAAGYGPNSAQALVIGTRTPDLDLVAGIGQRRASFRWELVNRESYEILGEIRPLMEPFPTLGYDASRTTKRELRMTLQQSDRAEVNILTDAIRPYLTIGGVEWPLGLYAWAAPTVYLNTGGDDGDEILMDRMSVVDRQLVAGVSALRAPAETVTRKILADMTNPPRTIMIESSPYSMTGAWRMGTTRGSALASVAEAGDYETPWFDFEDRFRQVRTVDPAAGLPSVDWDLNRLVLMETPTIADNLVDLPNRFVVIGNGAATDQGEIVGVYEVPSSAPHSIQERDFVLQATYSADVSSPGQARAVARNIGLRSQAIQQLDATTPLDPRFDGPVIVRRGGVNWLSVAWTMQCLEGGDMTHTLRRGYQP